MNTKQIFIAIMLPALVEIAAAQNEWSEPINLGPIINTDRDESYPFISYDGNKLFFYE